MDISALNKLSYGLYIAGAQRDGVLAGSVVDAVMQAALTPPVVAFSSMKRNQTHEVVQETGVFTLSVLPREVDPFVVANFGFQSGRNVDKWQNCPHELKEGLPVLAGCVAYVRCRVKQVIDLQSHTLFLSDVEDAWTDGGEPLVYADYQNRLKTATMEAFKVYQQSGHPPIAMSTASPPVSGEKKAVWTCGVCGYEYDGNIPFEELPEDYVCPLCKQPKSVFVKK